MATVDIERFTFKTFCINKLGENEEQDTVINFIFSLGKMTMINSWETHKSIEDKLRKEYVKYIVNLPNFE
jgi:hypothetical protein